MHALYIGKRLHAPFLLIYAFAAVMGAWAVEIRPGNVNVVIRQGAEPAVQFAAYELTNYLSRVLGAQVPVAAAPVDGKVNVFLGENEWSRTESLDPKPLVRDGFISAAKGNGVYLLGVDDARIDPRDTFTWRADLSKAEQDAYIRRAENVMKGW